MESGNGLCNESEGRTRDEIAALEIARELADEPIQLSGGEDRTRFYVDGVPTNITVNVGDELATIEDGTPVVTVVPDGGGFVWHEIYNPDGVDAQRSYGAGSIPC
jgi:hypothetical protein